MEKPKTLGELEALLKELETDARDYRKKNYDEPVAKFKRELWAKEKTFIQAYDTKIDEVNQAIREKKKELKTKKDSKWPPALLTWFKRKFGRGVNFGYGGLLLRHLDTDNRFIIVTINGGTAGTGTAMGTGGYYYANSSHFIAFPQYGDYLDAQMPHGDGRRTGNNNFEVEGGKLTSEVKNALICKAREYCDKWNVPAIDFEKL